MIVSAYVDRGLLEMLMNELEIEKRCYGRQPCVTYVSVVVSGESADIRKNNTQKCFEEMG